MPKAATTPDQTPAALWRERTFTYGSLTITVRRKTVGTAMVRDSLYAVVQAADVPKIVSDHVLDGYAMFFARIVSQTAALEGPLTLPDPAASPTELRAAFDDFRQWDHGLLTEWLTQLSVVDRAPGDPAYWPKAELTEDELKKMPPAASPGAKSGGASSSSSTATASPA
jgi:hypothetical protein